MAFLKTRGACHAENPVWQAPSITDVLDIMVVMATAVGACQVFVLGIHPNSPNSKNAGKRGSEPSPFDADVQDPELDAKSRRESQRHKTCVDCE